MLSEHAHHGKVVASILNERACSREHAQQKSEHALNVLFVYSGKKIKFGLKWR